MIVSGTAGTGKSYLISAIANLLGSQCILTGTTGMAAFNICGRTLHSTLHLPINSSPTDLHGNSLQRLQLTMQDKKYLIIDEMSMLGQRTMAVVDKRLRQATGCLDIPLGGISVILFGDFAQLPPVGDRPLYSDNPSSSLMMHGYTTYRLFNTIIFLEQILQQQANDEANIQFKSMLGRLRDGQTTQLDWQLLLSRSPQNVNNIEDFRDAIRLFYDRQSVAEFNLEQLRSLNSPIAQINALHSNSEAARANPDDAGGLHVVLFIAQGARIMLTMNIWQEVGLCNGSAGTIHKILYKTGTRPPDLPVAVLVDFDVYSGPPFIPERPQCVPVSPTTFEWNINGNRVSRQQLSLLLRYAITIHKSQGQTLNQAVIDIGQNELASGCTFVALSRVKNIKDLIIQPMSWQRLEKISNGKNFKSRLQEEQRLRTIQTH